MYTKIYDLILQIHEEKIKRQQQQQSQPQQPSSQPQPQMLHPQHHINTINNMGAVKIINTNNMNSVKIEPQIK